MVIHNVGAIIGAQFFTTKIGISLTSSFWNSFVMPTILLIDDASKNNVEYSG